MAAGWRVVLAGFVMLTLTNDLRRGRRVAWAVTVLTLVISIVGQVLEGDWTTSRPSSPARPRSAGGPAVAVERAWPAPEALRHRLVVTALAVLFTLAYGAIGFNILPNEFSRNYPLGPAIWQSIALWTQFWASRDARSPASRGSSSAPCTWSAWPRWATGC